MRRPKRGHQRQKFMQKLQRKRGTSIRSRSRPRIRERNREQERWQSGLTAKVAAAQAAAQAAGVRTAAVQMAAAASMSTAAGAGAGLSAPAPAFKTDPKITDSDLETSRSAAIERGGDDTIDVGLPAAAVARGPVTATATAYSESADSAVGSDEQHVGDSGMRHS